MKVVCFNGSPKGKDSNTHVMIEALSSGFRSVGAEVSGIQLAEKKIDYCSGCYTCWTKTPGRCVKQDDMAELIEAMQNADLFVFGTPLYFNNVSGTFKVFFDRLTAAGGNPHKTVDKPNSSNAPKIIMAANCGFPIRSQFDIVSLWIKNVAAMMRSDLIGEFYTTNGKTLTQPAEEQRAARDNYLEYLKNCGECIGKGKDLPTELKALSVKNILDFV